MEALIKAKQIKKKEAKAYLSFEKEEKDREKGNELYKILTVPSGFE